MAKWGAAAVNYHDALAAVGASSAHPGGFASTRAWMKKVPIDSAATVLEVGCGTGRTACTISKMYNATVIGVDIHPQMIAKATSRAQAMRVPVTFMTVERGPLPFAKESMDVVVAESVTVFNDIAPMLSEYYRVLRPGGFVLDIEMSAAARLPDHVLQIFRQTYGAVSVPTLRQWKTLYTDAQFVDVRMLLSGSVPDTPPRDASYDAYGLTSGETYSADLWRIMQENQQVMATYSKWLHYGVILARKQPPQ